MVAERNGQKGKKCRLKGGGGGRGVEKEGGRGNNEYHGP